MALCHLKNSELTEDMQSYKGRVVYRGDLTKDEDGHYAVFTEQGTSASQMSATKFIDVIARVPGNAGEDSDALKAYTQIPLKDATRLLGLNVMPETWVTLPPSRWPKSWWGRTGIPWCHLRKICMDTPLPAFCGTKE